MISENVDRLSELPEEIVTQILSRMSIKFAVRCSVLSKRLRYSWMLVTNIVFDDMNSICDGWTLRKVADQVLKCCKTSQVGLFRIHFPRCLVGSATISHLINEAVRLNAREIDIDPICHPLPLSLFTCKALTKLKLCTLGYRFTELLCPVNLPCLENLDIIVSSMLFVHVLKLISGCPMLESLSLEFKYCINHKEDYIFSIPTLKRLKLTFQCPSIVNKFALHVPNLEYLFVGGFSWSSLLMEDMPCLVEASILFHEVEASISFHEARHGHHPLAELVKRVSEVKSLSIHYVPWDLLPPVFPNVEHLELKSFCNSRQIVQFLKSCPRLKHLRIEKLASSRWIRPNSVPACMLTNLLTVKLSICEDRRSNINFLEYMLRDAEVLKMITITLDHKTTQEHVRVSAQLRGQLLKLVGASSSGCCQILFVGNLSPSTLQVVS